MKGHFEGRMYGYKDKIFKAIKITFGEKGSFLYFNSRCFSFKKQTICFQS